MVANSLAVEQPLTTTNEASHVRTQIVEKPGKSQAIHGAFAWPHAFVQRRLIADDWENTPWISMQEVFKSPEDAISFFFRTDDDSVRYHGRVRPILDICHGESPGDLNSSPQTAQMEKQVAWLIEGREEDGLQHFRPCLGSLSATQLTDALLKKRYGDESGLVDAERRLIYLTDLDCWTIHALIKTAPESQARALGDFLHKHLCSKSSIGVSFASDGPDFFSLEFHIPFRVWRTTPTLLQDDRVKRSDNEPLRSATNVTFLAPPLNTIKEEVHGIYSGHVACMVTGYDMWRWTAHFAIDTWFEGKEGVNDKVTRYDSDRSDGMDFDPCSGGKDDAKLPYSYPRVWFLRILGIRLDQVKDEWESILLHLSQGISRKGRRHKQILSEMQLLTSDSVSTRLVESHAKEIEDLEVNLHVSRELLQGFSSDLQETVKIGASFMSTEVNFFLNNDGYPGDASECYPYLTEIRRKFNELGQLYLSFESMQIKCEALLLRCEGTRKTGFIQFQSHHCHHVQSPDVVSLEASKSILILQADILRLTNEVHQLKMKSDKLQALSPSEVEEVRALAFFTLLTLPYTHTTAFFSADGVIGFTRNWKTFLATLTIAYTISIAIVAGFVTWIRKARQKLKHQTSDSSSSGHTFSNESSLILRPIKAAPQPEHASPVDPAGSCNGLTRCFRRRPKRPWLNYGRSKNTDDNSIELGDVEAISVAVTNPG